MPEGVQSKQIYLGEMMTPLLCPLRTIRRRLAGAVLSLCLLVLPQVAGAGGVDLAVENADLQAVIKMVGALTGTTFLFDSAQVQGKITLLPHKQLSSEETLQLLQSALALHGYTLLTRAEGTWIVPAAQAARRTMRMEVIPLNYARAEEVAATLSGIAPPGVRVAPYAPTNSLFISGDPEAVEAEELTLCLFPQRQGLEGDFVGRFPCPIFSRRLVGGV